MKVIRSIVASGLETKFFYTRCERANAETQPGGVNHVLHVYWENQMVLAESLDDTAEALEESSVLSTNLQPSAHAFTCLRTAKPHHICFSPTFFAHDATENLGRRPVYLLAAMLASVASNQSCTCSLAYWCSYYRCVPGTAEVHRFYDENSQSRDPSSLSSLTIRVGPHTQG